MFQSYNLIPHQSVLSNVELAEQYSTRMVKLRDGNIIGDTDPYDAAEEPVSPQKSKKISMSFTTALSLSFNNLRTKKRTDAAYLICGFNRNYRHCAYTFNFHRYSGLCGQYSA